MRDLKSFYGRRQVLLDALGLFFRKRSYVQVQTPILVPCPGTEEHLEYFSTHWQDFRGRRHPLWLRSSPELHMKQLLAEGLPRIYQCAPSFRNAGELGPWHHPEFLLLEWYQVGLDLSALIQQTRDLLQHCLAYWHGAVGHSPLCLDSFSIRRIPDLFQEFLGVELQDEDEDLWRKLKEKGLHSIREAQDFETSFHKAFLERIEPRLKEMGMVALVDYPASQAALARVEGGWAKRVEFYLHGVELCNGFWELVDPEENKKRLERSREKRCLLGKDACGEDLGFQRALEKGIPSCSGNALGLDRLLALLSGDENLENAIPFRDAGPYIREHRCGD